MSTLVVDRGLVEETSGRPRNRQRTGTTPVRAPRRRDQLRGPGARPVRVVPAPSIRSSTAGSAQACRIAPIRSAPSRSAPSRSAPIPSAPIRFAAISSAPSWRLTERGVAVVLVVALMLAVAALTVIGLTAVRVTSPSYQVSSAMPVATLTHVTAAERAGL